MPFVVFFSGRFLSTKEKKKTWEKGGKGDVHEEKKTLASWGKTVDANGCLVCKKGESLSSECRLRETIALGEKSKTR